MRVPLLSGEHGLRDSHEFRRCCCRRSLRSVCERIVPFAKSMLDGRQVRIKQLANQPALLRRAACSHNPKAIESSLKLGEIHVQIPRVAS